MTKYINFICFFLFILISCNRDRNEHKFADSSSKKDTIHNYYNEAIPPLLPDIDTINNVKPSLHILKVKVVIIFLIVYEPTHLILERELTKYSYRLRENILHA